MKATAALSLLLALLLGGAVPSADALTDNFQFVSPRPGAELVAPETTIILRPFEADRSRGLDSITSIRLQGSVSGPHPGTWIVSDDGDAFIYRPSESFTPGETVSAFVDVQGREDLSFSFTIASRTPHVDHDPILSKCDIGTGPTPEIRSREPEPDPWRGYTLPEEFPEISVTISDNPAEGFLFLANEKSVGEITRYLMMLDNTGFPVFFREMPDIVRDFRTQPTGHLTYFDRSVNPAVYRVMDDTFTLIDEWAPDGYDDTDGHDFSLLPNGHALIFARDYQIVDMSQIVVGGDPSALVIGCIIQEQDASKNVVFQWRSWDHYQITDASGIDFTAPVIDYVHFNSCEVDVDGNLMISCRHLNEVTKIDRQTGDIIWRMGGSQNQFTLVGDAEWFTRQHSARRTATGTLTIFDNGTYNTPQESRVVEYGLDEVNKIATHVWEFRNTPPIYAFGTGNSQRLPNGNTLISWGGEGVVTEVRNDSTKAFEMNFVEQDVRTYRAFRHPWTGVAAAPYLWTEVSSTQATLHFAKFGDPDVVQFHIYAGNSPAPTSRVGSTPDNWFSLDVSWPDIVYVRVTAENSQGHESPFSNEEEIVALIPVNANVVENFASRVVLHQNHPNPFALSTTISFELPNEGAGELSVYDVSGRLVRTLAHDMRLRGLNEVVWDGTDARGRRVGSGVYLYRLRAGEQEITKRVTLIR